MDTAPETHLDKLASRMSASENLADGASALSPLSSDSLLSIHYRVLDMMAEGVTVSDEDGIIQYTNAAEDEMFGYGRGELSGLPVGVQNAREVDGAPPLRTAGAWREEQLNRKKDGTFFGTRATISSLEVSGKRYRVCVHEDITERQRSESELRNANESFRALITASPLPIAAFGRDGLITLWNPAAERVFGWTAAEVLGKPLPFIPAEKADEHRSMRERDLMGENFANREVRRHRKDGTPIDITVSTAPMRDDSGQITGIMSVYVDITEQKKQAEEQRHGLEMLRIIERQLMLLVDASATLLASPESEHVLETIIRLAQQFIDAEAYAVWRKNTDAWQLVASAGLSATYERTVLRNAESTREVLSDPLPIEDVETCEFVRHRLPPYREEGIRSMLSIPLHIHGEIGGTIVFYYHSPHTFTDAETRVGGALANLAASALSTAELYGRQTELLHQAEEAERRSRFLAQVGEILASSLDYETTLASVAKLAVPSVADWCSVQVADASGGLRHIAVEHVDPTKVALAHAHIERYPPTEGDLALRALRTGQSVLLPDIPESMLIERARDAEHLTLIRQLGIMSIICAPMMVHGRALGVITFVSSESGKHYGASELEMAEEIARRAAVAVENARLFKDVSESEERFRRLYDSNLVGVAFWHVDGYITAANDAYLRLLGIPPSELESAGRLPWRSFTPEEYRAVVEQIIRECRESGASGTHEMQHFRTDGTRVPVLIAAAFLSSTKDDGVAFVLDITERKRLEQQFRGVAEIAVELSGASGVEEVLRIIESQARSLIGANASSARLSNETAPTDSDSLTVSLKNRTGHSIGSVQLSHKNSGEFSDSDRAILIQLAEMASIAIENISLNSFLVRSNEELRRANEDLNQFAYSASHDLQEPLRMIAIYTQLLSRKCGSQLDSEAHKFVRYTVDGAQRMEMLLRDLLAYTQAVNIRGIPDRLTESHGALQSALANLQSVIADTNADIRVTDLPNVRAYDVHLVQLFQNLIGNALKYRAAASPVIDVSASWDTRRSMWLFSMRDNGMGIDPKYHQQVFGLFKRLHARDEYPGTGIGLAICQKVVERYGGEIWVESDLGQGATFLFTLPG
jgi:PAS domain S-box-containing protein